MNEPKLSNYILSNQVYEKDRVFGDIAGDISGFVKHFDIIDVDYIVDTEEVEPTIITKTKTTRQTGRTETNGIYKRWEYYYSDGTTYWGNWIKQSSDSGFSIIDLLRGILQILFLLFVIVPFIAIGWRILLPLLVVGALVYLVSLMQPVLVKLWSWFSYIFGLAFVLFLVFGVISLLINATDQTIKTSAATDTPEEIREVISDPITGDSIISHLRIWNDYNNNEYSGYIQVKVSDYKNVANYRDAISVSPQNPNQYNEVVSQIYDFDRNRLDLFYMMLDSLRIKHSLSDIQFAEVITSCIQDIPYVLVLNNDCIASLYNDDFINHYLSSGGKCVGYVKFGLFSPTEFMGSLIGDCDTRTLLLFTVLNHYNYDVAMLTSELYRHSLLGINLPYEGVSKIIDGKRYILWETTAKGIRPGVLPEDISDMRFWNVSLISNNNISL